MRLLFFALCATVGCARISGYSDAGPPGGPAAKRDYVDGPDGLRELFGDVLRAAQADDRLHVHDLLAELVLSDAELDGLFGVEAAGPLKRRYQSMMEQLVNRGGIELVGMVYERKYDEVEIIPIVDVPDGGANGLRPEDRAVRDALKKPLTLYSIRIKKKGEARGLRYDFFFYAGGKWRTGNQLGQVLLERAKAAPPPIVPPTAPTKTAPTKAAPPTVKPVIKASTTTSGAPPPPK